VDRKGVVLVIDNYDSFTYNLVQYLGELGEQVVVHRNNEITLEAITMLDPIAAVLSPGPGVGADPADARRLPRSPVFG
jgi:anthranilate/para-aminobenzoate synthase component II